MDEATRQEIIDLAERNNLDPEQLLAIATADGLSEDLQTAMATHYLGDITIFGQALGKAETVNNHAAVLFIGIQLPDAYREALKPFTSRLSRLTDASVNWSRSETWHLTLKFLGDTEPDQIPAVIDTLAAIESSRLHHAGRRRRGLSQLKTTAHPLARP